MNEKQPKTTLEKLEEEINQKSKQIDALRYALRLAEKEHDSAADMVANCPQNIYYEDWVKAKKVRGEYVTTLKTIDAKLSNELDALCDKCEQERRKKFEVFVQYLNKGEGMWRDYCKTSISVFDNLTDAIKHADNLTQHTKQTAVDGSYRVMIDMLENGKSHNVESRTFDIETKTQEEPVDDYYEKAPLKNLHRNTFFRKLRNGKPTSRVWVRGYWDTTAKKYCCIAFDDVNEMCFLKAETVVACGFTF